MIEGLRAEFPGAFRIFAIMSGPRLARASIPWAVLTAIGAQLIVSAIAQLLYAVIAPLLFPPREPPLFTFSSRVLWEGAGAVAAGAVVARAGGLRGTIGYLAFQLALLVLALPLRLFACSRGGSCDQLASLMVVDRWPFWLSLAIGLAISRFIPLRSGGSNQILRAAGALSGCATLGGSFSSLWLVYRPSTGPTVGDLFIYLSLGALAWTGLIAGGALAGRLLVGSRPAAALFIALVVIGPSFAFGVPFMRGQIPITPLQPSPFLLSTWSWAWTPVVASLAMFAAREIARRTPPRGAVAVL